MHHSIILTSFNRPGWVAQAIESVKGQTLKDWECIVADDHSGKEALSAIGSAIDFDARFRLLRAKRVGAHRMVSVVNQALTMAVGEVVHYLPDDDLFPHRRLEIVDEYLRAFPRRKAVYGHLRPLVEEDLTGDREALARVRMTTKMVNRAEVYFRRALTGRIDHGQVAHRRCFVDDLRWDSASPIESPDGTFYTALNRLTPIYPLARVVIIKRYHLCSVNRRRAYRRDLPAETLPPPGQRRADQSRPRGRRG